MKWLDKLRNSNFDFALSGKKFFIAPIVIFLVALVLFFIPGMGFNLGLDFTGGATLTISKTDTITKDVIQTKMDEYAAEYNLKYTIVEEENMSGSNTFTIKFNASDNNTEILTKLSDYFNDKETFGSADNVVSSGFINATTSNEKIMSVFWSILAACAGLMIYMLFRFKFTAGITTLLALAHDVLMICAFMVILHIEANTSFIAALLTVIAYSINNSLVVFDRVRYYEKNNPDNLTLAEMLNKSINRTIGRCVLTVLTTLATLITLTVISLVMWLPTLIQFALPIIIGLLVGTYSSLFLIAPMYLQFETARILRKQRKKPNIH